MSVVVGILSQNPIEGRVAIYSLDAMANSLPLWYTKGIYGSCFGLGFVCKKSEKEKIVNQFKRNIIKWGEEISGVRVHYFSKSFPLILFKANIPLTRNLSDLIKCFRLDKIESFIYFAEFTSNYRDFNYRENPPCWYKRTLIAPRGAITWYFENTLEGKKYQKQNKERHARLFAKLIFEKYIKKEGVEKGLTYSISQKRGIKTNHTTFLLTLKDSKFIIYALTHTNKKRGAPRIFGGKGSLKGGKVYVLATEKIGVEALKSIEFSLVQKVKNYTLYSYTLNAK